MSEYKPLGYIQMPKRSIQQTSENKFWNRYKQTIVKEFPSKVNFLTGDNDKDLLMIGHGFNIEFFNLNKEKVLFRYDKVNYETNCGAFKNNGLLSSIGFNNGFIKLFNLNNKKTLRNLNYSKNIPISCLNFDNNSSNLYVVNDNRELFIYDYSTDSVTKQIEDYQNDLIKQIKIEQDLVYTCSYDKNLKIMDLKSFETVNNLKHNQNIECFIKHDNILVTGSDCYLNYWDMRRTDIPILSLNNNTKIISSLCFNDNFSRVFVGSYNEFIHIYNKDPDGEILHHMKMKSGISSLSIKNGKIAIGLVNGNFILKKRDNKDIDEEEDSSLNKYTKEEQNLFKFLSEGTKTVKKDYKYYKRGIYSSPTENQYNIINHKPKTKKLKEWDKLMRKFKFKDALTKVLQINHTLTILNIIEELTNRKQLQTTIKNLELESVRLLLKFILKKLDSYNCQTIILNLYKIVLEHHIQLFMENENKDLIDDFIKINDKLKKETKILKDIRVCNILLN